MRASAPKGGIFISYRRGDTGAIAGRIADRLSQHFREDNVFMDVDAIRPGSDFVERIREAAGACDVLVAIIGPTWATEEDASGRRRIDDPNDFVALEIAAALERNVLVIPVLVEGAAMPQADQLPARLLGLSRRNALELSDLRFRDDVEHLIETIEAVMGTPDGGGLSPSRWSRWKLALAAGGPACVAVLAVLLLLGVFSSSSIANTPAAEQTLGLANSATGLTNQLTTLAGQLRGNPSPSQRQQLLTKLAHNHSALTALRAQANRQLASSPRVAPPIRTAIKIVVIVTNDIEPAGSDLTFVVRHPNSPTNRNRLKDAARRAQRAQQQAQKLPALLKPYLPSTPATIATQSTPATPTTPANFDCKGWAAALRVPNISASLRASIAKFLSECKRERQRSGHEAGATSSPATTTGEFASFAGTWGAHEESLVVDDSGTGHLSYADLTACPSCSFGTAPEGTMAFMLTSVTNGEGTGSVTASSDPRNWAIGAPVQVSLRAASPGHFLVVVIGGKQLLNFCNSTSEGQCGA